ncbi:MAG TPA: hypothetical protein VFO16_17440 [Pseudonocardiaceae bacterium]|nr:hypothetical protein [Pseudonocardiaceae bacterium]
MFTAALVEGLATGDTDRDEDGWVGLNELYDAEMARNDIGAVAEPAAAALLDVRVQTAEPELNFGRMPAGSAPVHQTIHLLGPPLARVCAFVASHAWIRVEESAEGFDVSVDTSRIGDLRGTITLKGPTGELTIPVHVDVRPSSQPQQSHRAAEPFSMPEQGLVSASPPASIPLVGSRSDLRRTPAGCLPLIARKRWAMTGVVPGAGLPR